jgi:hypothetical protein
MKIEILEISANELLELISCMNISDQATLLIDALQHLQSVHSDKPDFVAEVGTELVDSCDTFLKSEFDSVFDDGYKAGVKDTENSIESAKDIQETSESLNAWLNNGGY